MVQIWTRNSFHSHHFMAEAHLVHWLAERLEAIFVPLYEELGWFDSSGGQPGFFMNPLILSILYLTSCYYGTDGKTYGGNKKEMETAKGEDQFIGSIG